MRNKVNVTDLAIDVKEALVSNMSRFTKWFETANKLINRGRMSK